MTTLAHKIELAPTPEQVVDFKKACGTARFAYNWGLAKWEEMRKAGEKADWLKLKKLLNASKREQFSWMHEVTKCAPEAALANLGSAFANYVRDVNKPRGAKKARYPAFKKKGRSRDSFYLSNDRFIVRGNAIRMPHIGDVQMTEELRLGGKIMGATVSRSTDRWFVSIQVQTEVCPDRRKNRAPVGIDLGIAAAVTLSTGKKFDSPKSLGKHLKRLARLNRRLHRKKPGSKNREKAKTKVARLHRRVTNIRLDWLHKLTTGLTRKHGLIALEDLAVENLIQNRKLARAIADIGWGELERQLRYKAVLRGGRVVPVDRFFPSTQLCRKCGARHDCVTLADRTFVCVNPRCGHRENRDVNAARNILREGLRLSTLGRRGIDACGQAVSDCCRAETLRQWQAAWRKQEQCINTKSEWANEYICPSFR